MFVTIKKRSSTYRWRAIRFRSWTLQWTPQVIPKAKALADLNDGVHDLCTFWSLCRQLHHAHCWWVSIWALAAKLPTYFTFYVDGEDLHAVEFTNLKKSPRPTFLLRYVSTKTRAVAGRPYLDVRSSKGDNFLKINRVICQATLRQRCEGNVRRFNAHNGFMCHIHPYASIY